MLLALCNETLVTLSFYEALTNYEDIKKGPGSQPFSAIVFRACVAEECWYQNPGAGGKRNCFPKMRAGKQSTRSSVAIFRPFPGTVCEA
jgi:hypothetical protein